MTNQLIDEWIDVCSQRNGLMFLSNERNSWSYADLGKCLKNFQIHLNDKPPSTVIIRSDYSLESVAWLILGLSYDWNLVPIVTDNEDIIEIRKRIAGANYIVSSDTDWRPDRIYPKQSLSSSDANDRGVILFSSGSTGEPKAMCQDLSSMLYDISSVKTKPICMGLLLLFDHIGGLNTLFSGLRKSLHLVAPSNRNPRLMAELIEKYSVRVLPCSPTFLNMMDLDGIFNDFSMKSLRLITYGTERMPEQLLNRLSKKLPRVKFLQTFGTSETGIVQTKSLSSSSTFLTIDDPKVEWKIENNELWIKSSSQISGYINTTEKAIDDGWFKTGDLVESKNDNYFRIIGRKNEVINVGGEKVLPSEIEDFVMTIDGIQDCTAFSVSNGITGQAVGIKVVARESSDIKSLKKEIRKNSRLKLESFKIPVKIIFESKLNHTDRFKKKR